MQKLGEKRWFLFIVTFAIITFLVAYTISETSPLPLFALRFILGFIFVSFIPGHCLLRILFSAGKKIDIIEEIVLSIALSFSIVGLIGLFLGLTNIGLNFTSVTVSLTFVVLMLASLAFLKKHAKRV